MRLCWGTTPAMPGLSRFTSYDSAFTSAPRADRRTPLIHTLTRYSEAGSPHPHVNPLFRSWAATPTYRTGGPHAEQGVHMRDALESKSLAHAANPSRTMGQPHTHDASVFT